MHHITDNYIVRE